MAIIVLDNKSPNVGVLTPAEIWNIDSKMDDGNPGTGQVGVYGPDANTLANCTTTASPTATTAAYLLTSSTKACSLIFKNQF